ncbi:hypothetical protein BBJ28_00012123 [Nothophytophthora sp. Chile5]|nr:hypothetical protein BBJ28_00012123 [Nothophytophthora sp. Chile5]
MSDHSDAGHNPLAQNEEASKRILDEREEKPTTPTFSSSSDAFDDSTNSSPIFDFADAALLDDAVDVSYTNNDDEHLLQDIADNMIGRNIPFESPFGVKAQCYADYTASGKSLECIEQFMRTEVMPTYGNTHTTTSVTGLQTTSFREEARQIVARAVNARLTGRDPHDVVLFTGQGCTSAINKFITALGINTARRSHRASKRPVVFTCPFAHHSNLLPWRESMAVDVVEIPEANGGGLDLVVLERQLRSYEGRRLKIGTFAAASNLTGLLADVDKVSTLLHKYGALACWDYATCAPYVDIDMNPKDPAAYKDAIFFSGHKFVGGPGSPGVLVAKTRLLSNEVPTMPGGGTVLFVTEKAHSYLSNRVEREEGGTPDILGSIRLGLAFELKQRVGTRNIMALERRHVAHVRESLSQNDHIVLLGRHGDDVDQLPVFSFMVRFGDRFLHHNFVCALLNDLFGIQARGGCQCASPYAARLLGISPEHIAALGDAIAAKNEVLKPGVARMSVPYFVDDDEVEYILEAVNFVASHGWKFLPQYAFDGHTSAWHHVSRMSSATLSLICMRLRSSKTPNLSTNPEPIRDVAAHRRENLAQAAKLAAVCIQKAASSDSEDQRLAKSDEWLRWFAYPSDTVAAYEKYREKPPLTEKIVGPCQPQRYVGGATTLGRDGVPSTPTSKRGVKGRIWGISHFTTFG